MARDSAGATDAVELLRQAGARAGLQLELLDREIIERMELLMECSVTLDDCVRAMDLAEHVFDHYARSSTPFSEDEQKIVRIGSLLSDIGKTGPASANPEQRRLIARMFAIERVRETQMPVVRFLHAHFPEEAPEYVERFRSLGLDPAMTLREFWNLHSVWTLEVLEDTGVPREPVAAAAAHHLLEHVNPHAMVADDGHFTHHFGTNHSFDRPEKLVILLDKYDALRRRGQRDHAAAITWLRTLVGEHPRFGDDPEFRALIDVMDVVLTDVSAGLYGCNSPALPRTGGAGSDP